jgi:hypothetical protein
MQLSPSVTSALLHQHESLNDLIAGLSDPQIRKQVNPGKWSIFENLVHLQTYQHMFIGRIRRILDNENPVFTPYTAEADPLFHDNCRLRTVEVMDDLFTTRQALSSSMASLTEGDLGKMSRHTNYGTMILMHWLHFFLLHEAHHLFTIFKLAMELRKERL